MNNKKTILAYRAAASIVNHHNIIEKALLDAYENNREQIKKLSLKQYETAEQMMVKSFENYIKIAMVLIFAENDKTVRMVFTEALRDEIKTNHAVAVSKQMGAGELLDLNDAIVNKVNIKLGPVVVYHCTVLNEKFPFDSENGLYNMAYIVESTRVKNEGTPFDNYRSYDNESYFYAECRYCVENLQKTIMNAMNGYIQTASTLEICFKALQIKMRSSNRRWESVEETLISEKYTKPVNQNLMSEILENVKNSEKPKSEISGNLSTPGLFYLEANLHLFIEIANSSDLCERILHDPTSAVERKMLVNRAFINAETRGYNTSDENFKKNILLCQMIISDIVGGYIELLYRKEKKSLYQKYVQAAKLEVDGRKTNITRPNRDIKINKKQKDNFVEENSKLKKEVQNLEKQLSDLKKTFKNEIKHSSDEKQNVKAQLKKSQKQNKESQKQLEALEELLEQYERAENKIVDESISKETIEEMLIEKNIIIWGLRGEIAEKLLTDHPKLVCIVTDKRRGDEITQTQLDWCDGVVIVTNHTNHGTYWKIRDSLRDNNIPYVHMNKYQNNIDRFRSIIADLISRI